MSDSATAVEARVERFKQMGMVDMHFDLLMDLYDRRETPNLLEEVYWPELQAGGLGVLGVAIYLQDRYLPEMGLRVGLDQVSRLYAEVDTSPHFAICRSYAEVVAARQANKIALLITMEGVEPLGPDLDMLRVFYELGLRSLGLTHVRRNMAGDGGLFAPSGSSKQGLTPFGIEVVKQCEKLGIMLDLAHLNPAGVDDVLKHTRKPPIVSHSTPRKYFDIERNITDDHIREVGKRGGVVGLNGVLVSPERTRATIDGYIENIEYTAELAGADNVAIGFDFIDHIFRNWTEAQKQELERKLTPSNFMPELYKHDQAQNLTRRLIERGYKDAEIEKLLSGNWMRVMKELL